MNYTQADDGDLLAFVIPFGDGSEKSTSAKLQHFLHKPVAFLILPLFALANTCLIINGDWRSILLQSNSLGIILGLIVFTQVIFTRSFVNDSSLVFQTIGWLQLLIFLIFIKT